MTKLLKAHFKLQQQQAAATHVSIAAPDNDDTDGAATAPTNSG
jgi:hypothetical protein